MDQLCRTSLFGTETWLAKRNDSWPTNFLHYNTIVIEKHYLNQWHVSYIIYPYILKKSKLSNCCWAWSWRNVFYKFGPLHHHTVAKLGADSGGGQWIWADLWHGHSLDAGPSHNPKMQCVCASHMKSFDTNTYQHGSENPCSDWIRCFRKVSVETSFLLDCTRDEWYLDLITNQCDWVLDQYFIGIQGTIVTMTTWMCSCLDNLTCPSLTWANFHTPLYK